MAGHASRVGSVHGQQLQHGQQEAGDLLALLLGEVVLLVQHVWQRPGAQAMDVTQLAFSVEDLLRPFPGEAERFGEGAEEFDDLRDVVVVFAVLCAGLGVKQVIAGDEFEGLFAD